MKNICCILTWSIALSSCELVVDVDLPAIQDLLVVNCVFDAQGHWQAHVSQSKSAYDFAIYPYFDDATITVTRPDGSSFELESEIIPDDMHEIPYNYTFKDKEPIFFDLPYRIIVTKEGFPVASAETFLPDPVSIDSYEIDTVRLQYGGAGNNTGGYDSNQGNLTVRFKDLPGESYYALRLKVTSVFEQSNYDSVWQETTTAFEGLETNNAILEAYMRYSNELLISDKTFAGQEFEIKAKYYKYGLEYATSLTIELCSVSRSYYYYRKSQKQQDWVEGDPFAEPVPVKGNIENGYGIFAGISSDSVQIKL